MESSAGRLFGNCVLGLGVFLSFLAKQSLIPVTWEKGRSQAGLQLTTEPCSCRPAFWDGVGIAFVPLS